jgi:hypothetical protein
VSGLPDYLSFSEDNLQVQMSMFETSSNTGAWSFCCMHVIHASCVLALHSVSSHYPCDNFHSTLLDQAKQRGQRDPTALPPSPITRLDLIMTSLGGRAKHSLICEHDARGIPYQIIY